MNTKFRAKLKTADEILGTEGVVQFRNTGWNYTETINEKAERGEFCTYNPFQSDITSSSFSVVFDDGFSCIVHEIWLRDVEEIAEPKVESKYPEFTEENVDSIIDQCTRHINNLLDDMPNHLPFPDITSIVAPDKKIENFMNEKKQLVLKIVDTLSKMFKSSCCPFCEANTSVEKSNPNFPHMNKTHCGNCSYSKYYGGCEESSFSIYHNIRKANEQLREAIEKYWR